LEAFGNKPESDGELVQALAGATLVMDLLRELRILRKALTTKA
jgi:hypothetical protein